MIQKSKSKISYHPDRIYVLLNEENIENLIDNTDFDIDEPYLIKIDVSKFKYKNKFYIDPNLIEGGAYILNNIPPNLIKEINKI